MHYAVLIPAPNNAWPTSNMSERWEFVVWYMVWSDLSLAFFFPTDYSIRCICSFFIDGLFWLPHASLKQANFSFPSGHSSLVCCGMTFLVWYLHGASGINSIHYSHKRTKSRLALSSRVFSLIVCTCLPWGWALFVAASRLVDHWHHPSDVLAGLALGFATCTIAYHHWYPPIWSPNAGIPRSLLMKTNTNNSHCSTTDTAPHTAPESSITTTTTSTKRRQLQPPSSDDMAWF